MKPKLFKADYVVCSVSIEQVVALNLTPLCQFRELEKMTLIITQQAEQAKLDYEFVCRMITLLFHFSLETGG